MNAVEHGPDAMAVYAVDTADAWAVRQLDCGWIRSDLGEFSDAHLQALRSSVHSGHRGECRA